MVRMKDIMANHTVQIEQLTVQQTAHNEGIAELNTTIEQCQKEAINSNQQLLEL